MLLLWMTLTIQLSTAQWMHTLGNTTPFIHQSSVDTMDPASAPQIQQFLLDIAGLPSDVIDGPAFPLQADVFQQPQLNVLIMMQGEMDPSTPNTLSIPVEPHATFDHLPHLVHQATLKKHGKKALMIANDACQLPYPAHTIASISHAALEQIHVQDETLQNDIAQLKSIVNTFANDQVWQEKVQDEASDMIVLCSSALANPQHRQDYLKHLESFTQELEKIYQQSVLVHVISMPEMNFGHGENRRLQETEDPDANTTSTVQPLTMADIESYQVILWTSLMLSVTLLVSLCCLCNMPIKRDSLLYAKFQTGAEHRKVN